MTRRLSIQETGEMRERPRALVARRVVRLDLGRDVRFGVVPPRAWEPLLVVAAVIPQPPEFGPRHDLTDALDVHDGAFVRHPDYATVMACCQLVRVRLPAPRVGPRR